jgi:hypothetical protein
MAQLLTRTGEMGCGDLGDGADAGVLVRGAPDQPEEQGRQVPDGHERDVAALG